mgnify:CR=1 FL=1
MHFELVCECSERIERDVDHGGGVLLDSLVECQNCGATYAATITWIG